MAAPTGANPREGALIARIRHGWTLPDHADTYERLLRSRSFPGIAAKNVAGCRGVQLLRRPHNASDPAVEFVTIMWFDCWDAVREFAGDDPDKAYVPAAVREVLARYDARSSHYEIRDERSHPPEPPRS